MSVAPASRVGAGRLSFSNTGCFCLVLGPNGRALAVRIAHVRRARPIGHHRIRVLHPRLGHGGRGRRFCIRRRTKRKRRMAQLKGIRRALRRRLHRPVSETGAWLHRVLQDHINYYGVPMNSRAVAEFCYRVRRSGYWSLCRRSQRKRLNWQRFARIANYWLPPAKVVHPYPQKRFDAKYSR